MSRQQKRNLLPVLDDGRPHVLQLSAGHVPGDGDVSKAAVVTDLVREALDATGRVPFVFTGGPGEGGAKGHTQVVDPPGQNHNVVSVTEEDNNHGGKTQTWGEPE